MITDLLASIFLVGGGFFVLVAGLGLLRFEGLHARMHAATKASGAAFLLVLIAECFRIPGWDTVIKSAVAMAFAFLTLPVAAHLLARSASDSESAAKPKEAESPQEE